MTESHTTARRPLKTRGAHWAHWLARRVGRAGITPNQISIASMVFAGLAGGALAALGSVESLAGQTALAVSAAACIQLRLLCNMIDGMVAVEGGLQSPTGELYNDVPDRISDAMILVGVGYGVTVVPFGAALGWAAALWAVMTAYMRMTGGACGCEQSFRGIMAKPQRMATLTAAALGTVVELHTGCWPAGWLLMVALSAVLVGSVITTVTRLRRIARELEARET